MPRRYRVELDDVEGHGSRFNDLDQGQQAVTVKLPDVEEYPAMLTVDDVAGHVDFGPADVEGHRGRRLDAGPQAVTIKLAGGEEMTGMLIAEDDDVEGHHVRKPTDFPNSTVP